MEYMRLVFTVGSMILFSDPELFYFKYKVLLYIIQGQVMLMLSLLFVRFMILCMVA